MPRVQTTWAIRTLVIACFASRVGVVLALIAHTLVSRNFLNYADPTWALRMPTIWSQNVMNIAIITACVPGMQQILADLRPGMTAMTVTMAHQDPRSWSGGSMFGNGNGNGSGRDRPSIANPVKANMVFGSRTDRARADCFKSDGKFWELSNSNEVLRNKQRISRREWNDLEESESIRGLTAHDIVVTKEVICSVED